MVRLRDAVMAVALATGGIGCATFCDECDDFPMPGGPGGYSMMPGTYTGPPLRSSPDAGQARAATPGQGSTPVSSGATAPANASPAGEAAPTPPPAPPAGPGGNQGVMNGSGAAAPTVAVSDRRTTVSTTELSSPAPPASPAGGLPVPTAGADSMPPLP
jgi:hypothetical protein